MGSISNVSTANPSASLSQSLRPQKCFSFAFQPSITSKTNYLSSSLRALHPHIKTSLRELVQAGKDIESAYWELVVKDIQDACRLFEPIYDQTGGADGYVSLEVSPRLADDTEGTLEDAKWLHKVVSRPNMDIIIEENQRIEVVDLPWLTFLTNTTWICRDMECNIDLPGHVSRRLRQTFPDSYKLGFNRSPPELKCTICTKFQRPQ